MDKLFKTCLLSVLLLASACGSKQSKISVDLPARFDGKQIELISFEDSVVLASAVIDNGHAEFVNVEGDSLSLPLLTQLVVDGRVRGFYVMEPGEARLDSVKMTVGTPLNDRMAQLMERMEQADANGMDAYVAEAEKIYNENRDNVLGSYFGIEWLKYADPSRVDSLLNSAPASLRNSRRAEHYIKFARLRAATAPGQKYVDFDGEDASGKPVRFSNFVTPGKYTLVDFMASWCPYCIKDMPKLKNINTAFADKGLEIVSVAVRDKPVDTAAAVDKHGITWSVVFNTAKRPYDIYGFSGIPHYMLLDQNGTIVARGETLSKIEECIAAALSPAADSDAAGAAQSAD